MNQKFRRLTHVLVKAKLYITRSMGYAAIINSAMLLILLLTSLDKYGIYIPVAKYFFPLVIVGLAMMIVWGYFEDYLGMWEYEQSMAMDRSMILKQIDSKLSKLLLDEKYQK